MQKVNQILEYITSYVSEIDDIEVIWLYGSQAKGTSHSNSDIDIAIAFKNFHLTDIDRKLRPQKLSLILCAQLNISDDKLSIVDINNVPVYLSFNIVEYGRVFYCKNKVRELKEIQRIYSVFEFETINHKK